MANAAEHVMHQRPRVAKQNEPPKQRAAIYDTKIEGLSVAEAADRAGISEADVKVSVHRGLKSLMQKLGLN